MSELKMGIGETSEWYTPQWIFDALGLEFDLDPCSPGKDHWVPAKHTYDEKTNGLMKPWFGLVFMNPPFEGRNGHIPWLKRFFSHGNGIAIARAYTSSSWFHEYVIPKAETLLFPKGKTKFIKPDGTQGKSPSSGIVMIGCGERANSALCASGIGACMTEWKS